MKKNKKLFVLAALFLAVFAVGGTLAYLTDTTETETNTFTFGKVDITLTEESWVAANATDLTPGQVLPKDPKVTLVDGSKDAYVFIEVEMPAQVNNKDVLTLGTLGSDWLVVETSGLKTVYAYSTALTGTDSTTALFQDVTVNGNLNGTDIAALPTNGVDIKVTAYAIQKDNLGAGVTTPAQIWGALKTELGRS